MSQRTNPRTKNHLSFFLVGQQVVHLVVLVQAVLEVALEEVLVQEDHVLLFLSAFLFLGGQGLLVVLAHLEGLVLRVVLVHQVLLAVLGLQVHEEDLVLPVVGLVVQQVRFAVYQVHSYDGPESMKASTLSTWTYAH